MENDQIYMTRDIYLATTLMTLHFDLVGIDYQIEGRKEMPVGYFKFKDSQNLRDTEKLFWQSKLAVEPKAFITNWRALKAQVNESYKNPNY